MRVAYSPYVNDIQKTDMFNIEHENMIANIKKIIMILGVNSYHVEEGQQSTKFMLNLLMYSEKFLSFFRSRTAKV